MDNKLVIITPGTLPVPPVNGGAIEDIIKDIYSYEPLNSKYHIEVHSTDGDIDKVQMCKNIAFYYHKNSGLVKNVMNFARALLMQANLPIPNYYLRDVANSIGYSKFILLENRLDYLQYCRKKFSSIIIFHLHNDIAYSSRRELDNAYNSLRCADVVICVSKYIEDKVKSIDNNARVELCYNGVDTNLFMPASKLRYTEFGRGSFGIKEDDFVILFSGRPVESKGVFRLVNAFLEFKTNKKAKLLIVGEKQFGASLENSKHDIRLNDGDDGIIYTGFIPHEKMPNIYQLADVCVVPSIVEEACPMTLMEAMASGLPTIVTRSGGMPELVGADYPFIIDRAVGLEEKIVQSLNQLYFDLELRKKMSTYLVKRSNYFTLQRFQERFYDILNRYLI